MLFVHVTRLYSVVTLTFVSWANIKVCNVKGFVNIKDAFILVTRYSSVQQMSFKKFSG